MARRRWLWWVLAVLVLGLAAEAGRRIALSRSLYVLNMRQNAALDCMAAPKAGQRVLIFAPHEDDETLGCAGYIKQAIAAGATVNVVLMTNGEYPEISVVLFEETVRFRPEAFIRLGYRRQAETLAAMRFLGLPENSVTFLGYPNQYLNLMWLPTHWGPDDPVRSRRTRAVRSPYNNSMTPGAVYCGQSMLDDIEQVLVRTKPDIILTIHPNDIHVDHWPTYAVVRYALEELALRGESFARASQVYTYLIHRNHWPVPRRYRPWFNLDPPAPLVAVGETKWLALPLTLAETLDKRKATIMYETQGGGLNPLLGSFSRANELFGVVPVKSWPAGPRVTPTAVLTEPSGDMDAAVFAPHADMAWIGLSREGERLTVQIATHGDPGRSVGYHMSLHVGGEKPEQRVVASYDWQGHAVRGFVFRKGRLTEVDPDDCEVSLQGRLARLTVPSPVPERGPAFFMLRAWTTYRRRLIDQSAVVTLRLSDAPAEPH